MKLKKLMALMGCLLTMIFMTSCGGEKITTCGEGLAPLNAKITQNSGGNATVNLSSANGNVSGIPIKISADYKVTNENITQCVLKEFADLVVKRPELFDIEIDGQGKFQIKTKAATK